MTVKDIIREYLAKNGYDGLCYPEDECGCGINDLMPCGFQNLCCVPANAIKCADCEKKHTEYCPYADNLPQDHMCYFEGEGMKKDD